MGSSASPDSRRWFHQLHWQVLVALFLGVAVGGVCYYSGYRLETDERSVFWYPGTLFLRLLKMIVLPLIVTSVIVGVSSLSRDRLGKIGLKTVLYYLTTTMISVTIGLLLVNLINPGEGANLGSAGDQGVRPDSVADLLMRVVPTNVFHSLGGARADILGVIFFSICFGLALSFNEKRSEPAKSFFVSINEAIMRLTMWIMTLTPIGVFGLIAHTIVTTGFGAFDELLLYVITVILGLTIHATIVLPLLLRAFGKRSPVQFAKQMSPALLTAFSTSSSSATLPITIESARKRAGVPRNVAEFVLPLGATVNMDGTALYEAVAVMFIAQAYGVDMSLGSQIIIFLTATMAAIGAAGVPRAGLVTMVLVLEAVNLNVAGIGIILAVDAVLDMCRTTVNVWGDAVGAAIIGRGEEAED
jgi:Na+/H+-dicarboxylate symporter